MENMRYLFLVVLSLGLSLPALAETNRETLKNLYQSGTAPATSEDFPQRYYADGSYVTRPTNTCVIIDGGDQPYGFDVSRKIRITPPHGPLVPGKYEEKLVFGESFQSYSLTKDPIVEDLDLIAVNPIYRTWIDATTGVKHPVPAKLYARRSGEYIAYRVVVEHKSPLIKDEEYFGYCYPYGKALFFPSL